MSGRVLVPWWLVGGLERKRVTIDALADRMPERRWVLVGDDAGHDPRLFAEFARYRPERVMVIALRQVLDVDPPEIGASPRPEPVAGVAEIEARCQECSGGRRGLLGETEQPEPGDMMREKGQDPEPPALTRQVTADRDRAVAWPSLPVAEWQPTRDTLHLWTQVVGKIRLANAPLSNHWWNTPLYVSARGLTTSLIPHPGGRNFQIDFDFLDHQLQIATTDGAVRRVALEPRTVAEFHARVLGHLDDLGLTTRIWPMPVEIEDAIQFDQDDVHSAYDSDHAQRFWQILVRIDRVLHEFRGRFLGKASPVHLWWGALDLATSRFSGRSAPPHPGQAPNCGPHVMLEAYSHEVSSCGYWPGGDGEGFLYSYVYPEPDGFRDAQVGPDGARYNDDLGEFVLPYERVRAAEDPDGMLLEFLQTTYAAAADAAGWQRSRLERSV